MTQKSPAVIRRLRPIAAAPAPASLRWWGWGDRDGEIPASFLELLRRQLGISGAVVKRPVALEDVEVPTSRLNATMRADLAAIVGDGAVLSDRRGRVGHAAGKSYVDLMRQRSGHPIALPDAVVMPASEAEIAAVLAACERHSIAVVAFGGGTSVVGGVTPLDGGHSAVIALDMTRLDQLLEVSPITGIARFQAGIRGPGAEAALAAHGRTLGHFPQSFEYASLGGYAATRSVGQASSGYGRFDEMVVGLRCVTPRGVLELAAMPPHASGPSLLQALLGSEGTLGIISEIAVRTRVEPSLRRYEAWWVNDVASGLAALRRLVQAGTVPDVARLSDAAETKIGLALSEPGPLGQAVVSRLQQRSGGEGCLLVAGYEGSPESVTHRREATRRILRADGGVPLGRGPGQAWHDARFEAPYLRDPLIDRGVLVETIETAITWDRIEGLRRAVVASLRDTLTVDRREPLVGSHVSHIYEVGASLYFTVMAAQADDPVAQWLAAKSAVTELLLNSGAALSHHHGVGTDHAPGLARQLGDPGMAMLRGLKSALDPAGILNPGKLFASAG